MKSGLVVLIGAAAASLNLYAQSSILLLEKYNGLVNYYAKKTLNEGSVISKKINTGDAVAMDFRYQLKVQVKGDEEVGVFVLDYDGNRKFNEGDKIEFFNPHSYKRLKNSLTLHLKNGELEFASRPNQDNLLSNYIYLEKLLETMGIP